ncbi:GDSL-type esterase/lipase family protein [Brevundimonas sp. R86498]|uniref:GDSL-type esterase/lipase family protein n=1 Tax=Brevundimonas sp. R86498 TaxID=3093845 RepID=UPI0037C8E683
MSRGTTRIAAIALLAGSLALTAVAGSPDTVSRTAVSGQQAVADHSPQDVVPIPAAYVGTEWLTNHYRERTNVFSGYAPLNGGVAFVGDSITEGGDWAALFPGVETRNYGIGGDRAEGLLVRYRQVVDAKPGRIMLLIGTNDLANGQAPEVIAGRVDQLLSLWAEALPDTPVVVQSVLPRQPEFDARIRDLNARLKAASERNGAAFLDIHSAFVVGNDRLDPAVTEDDLHLTAAGYARWVPLIDACVRTGACG